MRETDVVLVAPNTLGSYKFSGKNRENLALSTLGAYLTENKISNELIDARLDHLTQEQVLEELNRLHPFVIGLTLMEQEPAIWAGQLVSAIKEEMPRAHIVAGSYFPTLNPKKCFKILPEIDSIAQGEGEETLLELTLKIKSKQDWTNTRGIVHNKNQTIFTNPRRRVISDLDELPNPTHYAEEGQVSKVSLEGSRGCFSRCTFCSIGPHLDPLKSSWRGKSPQKIVEELVALRTKYPSISQYRFVDSDFIGSGLDSDRIQKIAQGILRAGFSDLNSRFFLETQSRNALAIPPNVWNQFRQAGLHQVFIGIESGSDKDKKQFRKPSNFETDLKALRHLKDFGFNVTYGFIMINPWSDINDVLDNMEVLRSLGNAGLDKYFSELILTPGTRAYEMVSEEDGIYVEKVEGIERYLFPLPSSLENIRRVGRYMLENPLYRAFLEKTAFVYSEIDNLLLGGHIDFANEYKRRLDDINLAIFKQIVSAVQQNSEVLDNDQIEKLLADIIPNFESDILLLTNEIQAS